MHSADTLSDEILVVAAQSELPYVTTSYRLLISRYRSLVRSVVFGILVDTSQVDDVEQEVHLKVFRHLKTFEQRSSFKTWLMHIATNTSISANRKTLRDQQFLEPNVDDSHDVAAPPLYEEESEEFKALLAPLDEVERQIISLRFVAELEFAEISDILGLGLSATKMRYYRAVEKLKGINVGQ